MILTILKVILDIVIVLLLVVIALLAILLFVPIRYRFSVEHEAYWNGTATIRFNPVLLKVSVLYNEDHLEYIVRVFGGIVFTNTGQPLSWLGKKLAVEDEFTDEEQEGTNKKTKQQNNNETPKEQLKEKVKEQSKDQSEEHTAKSQNGRGQVFISKLEKIKQKKEQLLKVYHTKRFDQAKKDLVRYGKQLFHILIPEQLEGYVRFGMEDPASTGQIFGLFAMVMPLYHHYLVLEPDFQEKILKGNLSGKGKIRCVSIVKLGIQVILNKNLIKVTKKVKMIIEM